MLLKTRLIRYKLASEIGVPIRYIIMVDGLPVWIGALLRDSDLPLLSSSKLIKAPGSYVYTSEDIVISYYLAAKSSVEPDLIITKINRYLVATGLPERRSDRLEGDADAWREVNMDKKIEQIDGTDTYMTSYISERDRLVSQVLDFLVGGDEPVQPLRHSMFAPNIITIKAKLVDPPFPLSTEYGPDIFNRMRVSEDVIHIKYRSSESYHKIYSGGVSVGYNNAIYPEGRSNDPDSIYMIVWAGRGNRSEATKRSYAQCRLDLNSGVLELEVPFTKSGGEIALMSKRVSESIGSEIEATGTGRTSGEFYVYGEAIGGKFEGINYIEEIFLDVLINNMTTLVYMDESHTAYPERVRKNMAYRELERPDAKYIKEGYIRNLSSVMFSVSTLVANGTESLIGEDGSEFDPLVGSQRKGIPRGTRYVKINVTKASSYDMAREFTELMPRILAYYNSDVEELIDVYKQVSTTLSGKDKTLLDIEDMSKVDKLKRMAPDIFTKGYARKCQTREKQPELISKERIPGIYNTVREAVIEHNSKTKTGSRGLHPNKDVARIVSILGQSYQGKVINMDSLPEEMTDQSGKLALSIYVNGAQLADFPKDNPRFRVLCTGVEHKYPTIIRNADGPNSEEFPYLPCCAKKDKSIPGMNNLYNEYYRGTPVKKKPGNRPIINSKKTLPPGRTGMIPGPIYEALTSNSEDPQSSPSYFRLGVPKSPNSFMHSILLAVADGEYERGDSETRERLARMHRESVADSTHPQLYKQELYDKTLEDIQSQLRDLDSFFDPSLFYRGVEEYYDINIFMFEYDSSKELGMRTRMILPRFKVFHSYPFKERDCILIIKHWGSSSDRPEYPQCEIIIEQKPNHQYYDAIFGPEFSGAMYDMMSATNLSITWTVENKKEIPRGNWYSLIDYRNIIGDNLKGQMIDSYGKVRALVFNLNGYDATMIIPPSEPQNIESVDKIPLGKGIDIVNTFRQNPSAIFKKGQKIIGIWYTAADMVHAVYFPIMPTSNIRADIDSLPLGPEPSITTSSIETVNGSFTSTSARVSQLKRTVRVIIQLMIWIHLVLSKSGIPDAIDGLLVVTDSPPEDSTQMYDISSVQTKLPSVNTLGDILGYLSSIPGLVSNNRIVVYSDKMLEGIKFAIRRYDQTRHGLPIEIPTKLNGIYEQAEDFTQRADQILLIGDDQVSSWLSSISGTYDAINIHTKLSSSRSVMTKPYLYRDPSGRIYMIQNVAISRESNRSSALNVAYTWHMNRINIGFNSPPTAVKFPYVIFSISKVGGLSVADGSAGGEEEFIQLLMYNEISYAAMLHIL